MSQLVARVVKVSKTDSRAGITVSHRRAGKILASHTLNVTCTICEEEVYEEEGGHHGMEFISASQRSSATTQTGADPPGFARSA
jgi:hypothetical protein